MTNIKDLFQVIKLIWTNSSYCLWLVEYDENFTICSLLENSLGEKMTGIREAENGSPDCNAEF